MACYGDSFLAFYIIFHLRGFTLKVLNTPHWTADHKLNTLSSPSRQVRESNFPLLDITTLHNMLLCGIHLLKLQAGMYISFAGSNSLRLIMQTVPRGNDENVMCRYEMSFTAIYLQRTDSIPIDPVRLLSLFHKQKKSRFSSSLYLTALSVPGRAYLEPMTR
jgi:hypothetical protein